MTLQHPLGEVPFEHVDEALIARLSVAYMPFGRLDAAFIHEYAGHREPFVSGGVSKPGAVRGFPGTASPDVVKRAWHFLQANARRGAAQAVKRYREDASDLWAEAPDWAPIDYTVMSFNMPIAWLSDRYWVVVPHFASPVTKRHQQAVRGLIHLHEPWRAAQAG